MSLAQAEGASPHSGWRLTTSSLLVTLWLASIADGVLLCLSPAELSLSGSLSGSPSGSSLSLGWISLYAGALSALIAAPLSLLISALVSLYQRAYPQSRGLSAGQRAAWGVSVVLSAGLMLVSVQLALPWAHRLIKREVYQALALGGVSLLCAGLALLFTPLLSRALRLSARRALRLSVSQAVTSSLSELVRRLAPSLSTRARRPMWLVSALALSALMWSAPRLYEPLKTLPLAPLWLTLWLLWARASLSVWLAARLHARLTLSLGLTLALCCVGLWQSATEMSAREARLVSQRAVYAPHALKLARLLSDRDRDGSAALFAGGDCDDQDPRVRPGAYEPIGRDLNCNGLAREQRPSWRELLTPSPPLKTLHEPLSAPKHLIVLTIDALRYDAYRAQMPHLNRFALRAQDFERAYSVGAATYWSVPALMGSKSPHAFAMGRDQTPTSQERLLFEVLRDQGFHTALLSNVTIFFVRGLSQGALTKNYDTSHVTKHGASPGAAHMSQNLLKHVDLWRKKALRPHRARLALWGHYYDPHEPYFELEGQPHASDYERYLGAVKGVDEALAELFKGLEERELLKDTLVLLTADHGDEFGEHGGRFHGSTLYEEMTRVPLILYHPSLRGQRLKAPISHLDLAPTLLELLGVPQERRFEGQSWAQRLQALPSTPELSEAQSADVAFFEVLPDSNYGARLVGLSDGHWKLLYDLNHNSFELYDLTSDPQEQRDVSAQLLGAASVVSERLKTLQRALLSYAEERLARLSSGRSIAPPPWGSPPKKRR